MPSWHIADLTGDAQAFHSRPLPDRRTATFFTTPSPTLVLGSAQRDDSIDRDSATRQGIDVIRRRSGGGGVLLWPGDYVWLDIEIPSGDRLWSDDVGRAMWCVGELWLAALSPAVAHAHVHRGRLQRSPWSDDVCFAGVGPGEVMVGESKLVGISQRRTRQAARFQSMVHLHWRADIVASLIAATPLRSPTGADLHAVAATCPLPVEQIRSALVAALDDL